MERQFSSYEALFVFDLDLGDEGIKALIEKFKGMIEAAGKVIEVADWGKRRLAYPINDKNEGYYTLITFEGPGDLPAELNRVFNITDGTMRAMITKAVKPTAKTGIPSAVSVSSADAAAADEPVKEEDAGEDQNAADSAADAE